MAMPAMSSPPQIFTHSRRSSRGEVASEPSPKLTPAIMQSQPLPWAVATPSPMPFQRWPQAEAKVPSPLLAQKEHAGGKPLMSYDVLWEVCSPFITDMLEALQQAIAEQFEEALRQAMKGSTVFPTGSDNGLQSLQQQPPPSSGPFQSLFFNPKCSSPFSSSGIQFKGTPPLPTPVPIEEVMDREGEPSTASSSCASPMLSMGCISTGHTQPQKIQVGDADVHSAASKCSSPKALVMSPVPPDPSELPNLVMCGVDDEWDDTTASDNMVPYCYAEGSAIMNESQARSDVMYLSWQQQQFQEGQQAEDSTSAPGHIARAVAQQAIQQQDVGIADFDIDIDFHEAQRPLDKKAKETICRHWTTKGWCRMEDTCKFQHPEDMKGPILGTAKVSNSSTRAKEIAHELAAGGSLSTVRKARRSGRNRHAQAAASGLAPKLPAASDGISGLYSTSGSR